MFDKVYREEICMVLYEYLDEEDLVQCVSRVYMVNLKHT